MFIGRQKELTELINAYNSDKFESILIYGRRRVGKTELINNSLKGVKDCIIIKFEAVRGTLELNINRLSKRIKDVFNINYIDFHSFEGIFEFIFEQSLTKKIILIIDEFSFLLERDFTVESILAVFIDKYINDSKLKIVVSGSYVGLMIKLLEHSSHCYGRFNHIIPVRPFDYYEASLFYKNYSDEDKIIMYSTFGGLPFFNSLINNNLTALDNIKNLIISKNSILEFGLNSIYSETKNLPLLSQTISLIAKGKTKKSDIISTLKSKGNNRNEYLLEKLEDMDIVKRITPINDKSNNRKTFFVFEDNYLSFYYRYLYDTSYIELRENPNQFFEAFIKEDFYSSYIPKKFEEITKSFLHRKNIKGEINPVITEIGTYFYNDAKNKTNREFYCVTKDKNGYISYECKFTKDKIGKKVITEEEEQIKNLDINFYKLGFVSKNGFKNDFDKEKYNLFTLKDFYKD